MIHMIYDPVHGDAIPDGLAKEEAMYIAKHATSQYWCYRIYGTENVFNEIRHMIVTGAICAKNVTFQFEEQTCAPDEYGNAHLGPGFLSCSAILAEKTLLAQIDKMQEAKDRSK